MITQDYLKSILEYEPILGTWKWLISKRGIIPGKKVGCINDEGYILIRIDRKSYKAHRLAWLYMTGNFPANEIDHIDGNPSNNEWSNLREATNTQNSRNQKKRNTNTTGFKGIYWNKNKQKWSAHIGYNGKKIHLGYFSIKEEAIQSYNEAALKYHGEFAYLNPI